MKNTYKGIDDSWDIRYSIYIDDLILFDKKMWTINQKELISKVFNNLQLIFNKHNSRLLMVKIKNAQSILHINPNEYSKQYIIKIVKEYLDEQPKATADRKQYTTCRFS